MVRHCSTCGEIYRNKHAYAGHQKYCKPAKEPGQNATGQAGASSTEMGLQCSTCSKSFKDRYAFAGHKKKCKSLEEPGRNATGQAEASSSSQDGTGVLDFQIAKRPRTKRGAVKEPKTNREPEEELDVLEALVLLQEQPGNDTSSDAEPGTDNPGDESAADNPDGMLTTCSDKRTSSVECNLHPVVEIQERLSRNDAVDSSGAMQKDNQKLDLSLVQDMEYGAAIALMKLKSVRNSAFVDLYGGTEKSGNETPVVEEETELSRNDDGQGFVDCPENSSVMKLKRPKLDLKVPDNNDKLASDDAQGGNNDASGFGMPKRKQTSLTGPTAKEVDREPEQKLDGLEALVPLQEQPGKDTTSDDEPGTDNPGDESAADNSDEVLTSCSDKCSCSVEGYGGGERRGNLQDVVEQDRMYGAAHALMMLKSERNSASVDPYGGIEKSGNESPVVEEEVELSRNDYRQGVADCPEKSAVMELKKPKIDLKVLDNSVVMQEKKQKIDLSAPAPTNSSDEERSNVTDG